MPRVLRFINRFCMEGPIFNAAYLAKHLDGYETLVIGGSPRPHESHSGKVFSDLGISIIEIPEMGRAFNLWKDYLTFKKVKKVIQDFKPDIIHSHCFGLDGIPARFAATQKNSRLLVHTFHGHVFSHDFNLKTRWLKQTEKYLSKKWDTVIAISSSQKEELVETFKVCAQEKVHVIPLGIDLSRFENDRDFFRNYVRNKYGIGEDEIVIGIIARLAPVKNHQLFIDAIEEVKKSNKKVRAFIIGDGELKESLMLYARSKGLLTQEPTSTILFTSWIEKVEEVLPALDIFALTSHSEGTPVSIIEAQASGIPIVATNVGGVKDCLINNKTGILVPPSDVESMSHALIRLINDNQQRKEMGTASHAFAYNYFSYERLARDVQQLYVSLLNAGT